MTSVVAVFDLDGTLTTRDCVTPFLVRIRGWGGIFGAFIRRPVKAFGALFRKDRDALKDVIVSSVFRRQHVQVVDGLGRQFAEIIERRWMRADTLARMRWHQSQGHCVVIVSASLRPYLDPLGGSLGVDFVICTDVEAVNGRYVERLLGANCRGEEKAIRLEAFLREEGLTKATLWVYGDSPGDEAMLTMADHPVRVTKEPITPAPA